MQIIQMALITPSQIFGTGYLADASSLTIPLASIPGISAATVNKDSGNAMEILRGILEVYSSAIQEFAPAARPTSSSIEKTAPSLAYGPNIAPGTLRQSYTASFNLIPTALELSGES